MRPLFPKEKKINNVKNGFGVYAFPSSFCTKWIPLNTMTVNSCTTFAKMLSTPKYSK